MDPPSVRQDRSLFHSRLIGVCAGSQARRQVAGATPATFLNARLNAASES
jgi:hypothetical protein